MKSKTASEQPQHAARRMFPLNVPCCACGEEVQIDAQSHSGFVPPEDDGDFKGVAIPIALYSWCGTQPFCLPCAAAACVLGAGRINLAVLGRAQRAARITEKAALDDYYAELDMEDDACRDRHERLHSARDDYWPFNGDALWLQPPTDLEVTDFAEDIARHYRVLVTRCSRRASAGAQPLH